MVSNFTRSAGNFPQISSFILMIWLLVMPVMTFAESAGKMVFYEAANGGNCYDCSWTVAMGDIVESTPNDYETFIKNGGAPGPIVINSKGGNLFAGIKLGRLFRSKRVTVTVAKSFRPPNCSTDIKSKDYCPSYFAEIGPGACMSACAYAFLGGLRRSVALKDVMLGHEESVIGFHQFYDNKSVKKKNQNVLIRENQFSVDQLVSALLVEYLLEMGVSAALLKFSSAAGSSEIFIPDVKLRKELKITYWPDSLFGKWELDYYKNGLILYSKYKFEERITQMQQITIFCKMGIPSILFTVDKSKSGMTPNDSNRFNKNRSDSIFGISVYFYDKARNSLYRKPDIFYREDRVIERHTKDVIHFKIDLNKEYLRKILSHDTVYFDFEMARVFGLINAKVNFEKKQRGQFNILMKNCIR